jgi:hypothetical protein
MVLIKKTISTIPTGLKMWNIKWLIGLWWQDYCYEVRYYVCGNVLLWSLWQLIFLNLFK